MGKYRFRKPGFVAAILLAATLSRTGPVLAHPASITTVFASYGYAMERKDVKDDVVKLCDGKTSCDFIVKNEIFTVSKGPPDPSPGNDKGLIISWKCGDVTHKTQFVERRPAVLDCK